MNMNKLFIKHVPQTMHEIFYILEPIRLMKIYFIYIHTSCCVVSEVGQCTNGYLLNWTVFCQQIAKVRTLQTCQWTWFAVLVFRSNALHEHKSLPSVIPAFEEHRTLMYRKKYVFTHNLLNDLVREIHLRPSSSPNTIPSSRTSFLPTQRNHMTEKVAPLCVRLCWTSAMVLQNIF